MKHKTFKKIQDRPHASGFVFHASGFTLVELVVAIAVFAAIVTVVSSIFVSSVGSQRKNINSQDVLDNARYVLETMGRSIRQSIITQPAADVTQVTLQLRHPIKGDITYALENGQITETIAGNKTALSSANVIVQSLTFAVWGNALPPDDRQPKVTISISLKNSQGTSGTESVANLQTTVTPRNLQIQ